VTMFLIRIPECQEAAAVVAEFDAGKGEWEISATEVSDVKVYAPTFEVGVREFAKRWRETWPNG
jgi:hypothetical protein